jgi:hypothetical protein
MNELVHFKRLPASLGGNEPARETRRTDDPERTKANVSTLQGGTLEMSSMNSGIFP